MAFLCNNTNCKKLRQIVFVQSFLSLILENKMYSNPLNKMSKNNQCSVSPVFVPLDALSASFSFSNSLLNGVT